MAPQVNWVHPHTCTRTAKWMLPWNSRLDAKASSPGYGGSCSSQTVLTFAWSKAFALSSLHLATCQKSATWHGLRVNICNMITSNTLGVHKSTGNGDGGGGGQECGWVCMCESLYLDQQTILTEWKLMCMKFVCNATPPQKKKKKRKEKKE